MSYENLVVKMSKNDEENLEVEASFPEDSDTGLKVNTDLITRRVVDEGYEFTRFLEVDTIKDESDVKVEGKWVFELPNKVEADFEDVYGIGKKTAEELSELGSPEFVYENFKKVMRKADLDDDIEARLKNYLRGKFE